LKPSPLIWIMLGAAVLVIVALVRLSDILLPFVLGFTLAYFLDPLADRLERGGLPRLVATNIITVAFGILLLAALVVGLPALAAELGAMVERIPVYTQRLESWMAGNRILNENPDAVNALVEAVRGSARSFAANILLTGLSVLNVLALVIITPVVAVYMLNDWDRMVDQLGRLLPKAQAPQVRMLAAQIDEILAGFVRGQITVCVLLGVFYATGLSLVGLDAGIVVGVTAGLTSFIPYVGAVFGVTLGLAMGLGQFGVEYVVLAQIAGVFVVGQFLEGNLLTPRLVGDRVRLHPVWVIFALLAMGQLFGFIGLLLAIPVAAAAGVLVRYAITLYMREYVEGSGEG
jgi:predicted PurR-regulated permease PerM